MIFPTGFVSSDMLDPQLDCPHCGGGSLHHEQIEIYDRNEDRPACTKTVVALDGTVTATISDNKDNPSLRRNGLRIRFSCETCRAENPPPLSLAIVQHKGSTYFYWE